MSEWETFCDDSYYSLWRVRRKNERGFNDGYHIHNGEEARALVGLLNGIERERDAIQEQLDFERELNKHKAIADAIGVGEAVGESVKDRIDALQEQLNAAIMLGKMQERRHERELEQVRLASAAERMLGKCRQSPTTDQ